MFDEYEFPNISFNFKETEAKEEIFKLIMNELKLNCESIKLSDADRIIKEINEPNYSKPVVEISDYKSFFTNLGKVLEQNVDLFNKQALLKFIWLRMTPDDFKHPEDFLKKCNEMKNDRTFTKYDNETIIENEFFKDYSLTVKNSNSQYFNESMKEMMFYLYNENSYYRLPVVRYGIYKRNNEKICEIGSVQHINENYKYSEMAQLEKKIERLKYKINKEVPSEYLEDIEPKNLISLLIFIKLLEKEEVTKISIPTMYPLDYEFHEKRLKRLRYFLENRWGSKNMDKYQYEEELLALSRNDRVDEISASKTTNFIKLFERLNYHLVDSTITNYPGEVSNYLEMKIDNLDNINGENIKKLLK